MLGWSIRLGHLEGLQHRGDGDLPISPLYLRYIVLISPLHLEALQHRGDRDDRLAGVEQPLLLLRLGFGLGLGRGLGLGFGLGLGVRVRVTVTSPLHLRYISATSPPYLLVRGEVDLLDAEGVVDDGAREEHLGRCRGDRGEIEGR